MLRLILELVLLAILLLCAWRGYRNGLISGILAACAVLFSFYAADVLADTYSGEFTKMLDPFVSGLVDSAWTQAETAFPEGEEPGVYDLTLATVKGVGIMKSAAVNVARSVSAEMTETGAPLRSAIVEKLCALAAYVITYCVMFILLIIAFAVIGNLFNLAFKLPGLELINGVLGTVLGLFKGILYCFAIAWALRFLGLALPEETVDSTILLKRFMEVCPLVGYLGV